MPFANVPVATTVVDSILFRDAFGTPAMRAVFSDHALIERYVEVEIALARAEARSGVIPAAAADEIAARSEPAAFDFDHLRHETEIVGYPILPVVHQMAKQCGEAGGYVHWGATTQDIMDTANVLQVRAALDLVSADIEELRRILGDLAQAIPRHANGGPHAPAAGAAHHLRLQGRDLARHVRSPRRAPRAAAAARGGRRVRRRGRNARVARRPRPRRAGSALAEELNLGVPASTWHVARDGFAEAVNFLALVTGSLGKIAYDVMLMMQNELGEVYEPFVTGRGASSTMPQKRNPISSELMLAASKAVRQHAGLMLDAMVQDFERATGPWHAEWIALPESFVLTAGALHQAKFMLGGLVVDEARMRKNLDLTSGLIVAEAVMMGLAPHIGRQTAHDVVYGACRIVNEKGGSLADVLVANPEISKHLDRAAIERLTDPANYLGMAPQMVDRVLASR